MGILNAIAFEKNILNKYRQSETFGNNYNNCEKKSANS